MNETFEGMKVNEITAPFFNLDPEKQQRIINAALKEFAQKGFEDASTIEIAKEAGISKGLLFHYFKSKQELFVFLYDYGVEVLGKEFFALINFTEQDLLERCRQIMLVKMELLQKYPAIFDFFKEAVANASEPIKETFERKGRAIRTLGLTRLFEDIDESKFKEGIDIPRAKNIILWTIEGCGDLVQHNTQHLTWGEIDYEGILAEYDAYLSILRTSLYRSREE